MKSSEESADNFELDYLPSGPFTPLGLCENFFLFTHEWVLYAWLTIVAQTFLDPAVKFCGHWSIYK
jgi:hypothetical protein